VRGAPGAAGAAGGRPAAADAPNDDDALVVVGASWGGLHAVSAILRGLPADHRAPLVVVQHRSREAEGLLARLLQDVTPLQVCEVDDKQVVLPAHVYVAPPDYHLLVEGGPGGAHFALSTDGPVRFSRPSIDVTMVAAAEAYGARTLAVVCTGANDDGARGARRVLDRGGAALVQDPATAEVRTMPDAACQHLATAPRARWDVVPLDQLGRRIAGGARAVLRGGAVRGAAA
jgi:two-component system chemotaxis response regulator CheB